MTHSFLPGAEAEYLDAVRFLEERSRGLGAALIAEFERVIGIAASRPASWKLVHASGIRQIGLKRFPYTMFFRVLSDGQLQVTAFAHQRRQPGYWLQRLKS